MRRKLASWAGLPAGCVEHDVERWLPLRPGEGIAHFGSAVTEYRFRVAAEAADFPELVRLYFRDSELSLVRTGIWSFDRDECTQLLNHVADPPNRVDLVIGARVVPDSEWVYPAKGLALGVIPETGLIASVSAYQPCGISQYLQTIHNVEQAREFRY
ncbi:hypothetical protein FZI85_03545 [Mycobacterium sp. CBMA293]|uniref:hypothetical protein n=1 Tax=unclassified Mycolicibacterium TaxID=2636767 RepID=UPI0012DF2B19|nr:MULTISPECIES: hypothetical protein [unclassified Mycolicibacterium]MUL47008.1 hypothetical protein [Mycolicibacterium sp. CBMA 360]MUL58384.1 hypothetical protein [Mycolicibacterium sp. CBMA 335]MUL73842.1 hypothetical protein [Mycolicibacterium sp. CBMA 311]MUL93267.1 hypothetical protein [Mycolicibacterium sp. CBMA 230]MUM10110.1 hypothetical protein [Mycolicibacterium sp. CBMA 293]